MAVPRTLTQLAFAAGLDESTEDEVLDPNAGFAVLQNVRQDRRGGASKRLGFGALPVTRMGASDRTAGRRLFSHRGTPCVIDGSTLDVYSDQLGTNIPCGRLPEATVTTRPLGAIAVGTPTSSLASALRKHDTVICNGILILVYASASGAYAQVSAVDDDVTIVTSQVSAATDPIVRVGSAGTTAILITTTFSGSTLFYRTLDCSSPAGIAAGWTGPTSFATNKAVGTTNLALCSLTNRVAIAYQNNSGGAQRVTVRTLDATGLIDTTNVSTSSLASNVIAINGNLSDTLWVAWDEITVNDDLKVIGLSPTSLTTIVAMAATVISSAVNLFTTPMAPVVVPTGPGAATVLIQTSVDLMLRTRTWTTVAGAVTPDAAEVDLLGADPASPSFVHGGRIYGLFVVGADVALCDWTDRGRTVRPVCYVYPGLASIEMTSHLVTLPDGRIGCVVGMLSASEIQAFALVVFDFADPTTWRHAYHNGSTFLSGGLLSYFSGDRVQETQFLHAPRTLVATNDVINTGPTGSVSYVAVFKSIDGSGNVSTSGVSLPLTHTGTGNQVLLSCDPLLMTSRGAVSVTWYRTVALGKIYYEVASADALQSPSAASGAIDDHTDAALISRPTLYGTGALPGTNGSALQRDAPPLCRDVVSYAGMLVIASGSDLWWSGQTVRGEGTWFSTESFIQPVEGPGDITALAVQDGTLYVFKERAIYVSAGEAPSDNGSSGGLGVPRLLAGDVGCIRTSSVVVTSVGIFFRSHRGIEVLAGGGRPAWIGEKVQNTLTAYPYVTSAVLDERNNIIRFSLASGFTATGAVEEWDSEAGMSHGGRDLVFDLVLNDWQSVDDKTGASSHAASQDAAIVTVDGVTRYAWLGSEGTLWLERLATSSIAYRDGAAWVVQAAETGWFKAAGIQGRQQFELLLALFRKRSPMDLSMALGFDYRETYEAATVRSNATLEALLSGGWPITQLRHDGSDNAEGQSVRVRIADAEPLVGGDDSGQGATWLAITLNITAKDGPAEVPEEAA